MGGSFAFSRSTSRSRPTDATPPEFVRLREPIADVVRELFETRGGAFGPSTAPVGDFESQILASLQGAFGRPSPEQVAGRNLLGQTLRGDFLSPESNPFLASTIEAAQRPLVQAFQDVTIPGLQSRFTQAGQRVQPGGSSAFDRAAALATRGLTQELGDISSQIAFQNLAQERGLQQAAIPEAEAIQQQQLDATVQTLQAAALPRLVEQFGLDRGLEEFNRRIETLLQTLSISAGLPIAEIGQKSRAQSFSVSGSGGVGGGTGIGG